MKIDIRRTKILDCRIPAWKDGWNVILYGYNKQTNHIHPDISYRSKKKLEEIFGERIEILQENSGIYTWDKTLNFYFENSEDDIQFMLLKEEIIYDITKSFPLC